jgi:hypothetical protein
MSFALTRWRSPQRPGTDGDLPNEPRSIPLAHGPRLRAHAVEPRWPLTAVGGLVPPGAPPRPVGLVVVRALPAGLRPEDRTGLLEPSVERGQPPRPAGEIRVERVAKPVVVGVRLARQAGGEPRVAVDLAEPPRPVRPDVDTRRRP